MNEITQKLWNGRKVKQEEHFDAPGEFKSQWAAEKWLHENGYSFGSSCNVMPIAIQKGKYILPQKWKNFDQSDKAACDGVITSYNWREGPVKVTLFEDKKIL